MRTTLVLVLLFGLHSILFAQEELIELSNEPVEFEADGFYIKKVTDGHANKNSIGLHKKECLKRIKFRPGLKMGLSLTF
jgi:hypothetical protein